MGCSFCVQFFYFNYCFSNICFFKPSLNSFEQVKLLVFCSLNFNQLYVNRINFLLIYFIFVIHYFH